MRQNIHQIGYLINNEYDVAELGKNKVVASLPKGAIVLSVAVEVLETSKATNFKLGINGTDNYFIDSAKGLFSAKATIVSEKQNFKVLKDTSVIIDVTGANSADTGKIAVRVHYFTPSVYFTEM
ncbi:MULTISPECIES: hypothetical protein [unclassified Campylobacter]|uniref:hypothetical protein n=1 Tax=unclassified Campylobacter TaxID=2593542 RepID=UPI003D32F2F1